MKRLGVTIRLGAGVNTLSVDGREFDLLTMDRADKNKLRRMVVEAWKLTNNKGQSNAARNVQ